MPPRLKSVRSNVTCTLHCKQLAVTADRPALTDIIARKQSPAILGANASPVQANRFSTWAAEPIDTFEFAEGNDDPFGKLQQALETYRLESPPDEALPKEIFKCGWIGYFSYDLGRYIEKIIPSATNDLGLPLIRLCFYDRAICYDHAEDKWWLIALEIPNDGESPADKLSALGKLLRQAENTEVTIPKCGDLQDIDISAIDCNMTGDYYLEALAKTREYIYDGEVYQINFSQRFKCDYTAHPVELYRWQNAHNPSPYAAYIGAEEFAIVSASPEMFITVCDGLIRTKPIKGTRRRQTACPDSQRMNEANFTQLVQSPKDQAELNMIIDLERNDLTRICKYGTIKVTQPRTIEAYPTVFHAVATIQGCLHEPQSPATFCNILKAVFPGGSITGAPKIRAMEIIEQLEPTQRSVYTGSIGFIGIDDNVCLNIAIRTVIIKDAAAFVQTGGGIVADSDPQAEWEETITKARALLAGIKAVQNATRHPDRSGEIR